MRTVTSEIALTLSIIVVAIVLFATEKLRVDVIALIVLFSVALAGLVGPEEVFAGFSNPAEEAGIYTSRMKVELAHESHYL
jgi:di/tricarboxylate transporter